MMNRKTRRLLLRPLLQFIIAVPGLYTLLAFLTARRVTVRGWSMHPALRPGDRVLFDRLSYWGGRPRRGDVVLAVYRSRPGLRVVKRIAAVPGETFAADGSPARVLARGEYALVGDNEEYSTDSRELGPVQRRDILARGWLVYWPLERFRRLP